MLQVLEALVSSLAADTGWRGVSHPIALQDFWWMEAGGLGLT